MTGGCCFGRMGMSDVWDAISADHECSPCPRKGVVHCVMCDASVLVVVEWW